MLPVTKYNIRHQGVCGMGAAAQVLLQQAENTT